MFGYCVCHKAIQTLLTRKKASASHKSCLIAMVINTVHGRLIVLMGTDTPRVQFYHSILQGSTQQNADALPRCAVSTAATFCSIDIP